MKKISNNPSVFVAVMGLMAASMLYGVFRGPEHPQIFFWSVMGVWVLVMALYVFTTIKDMALFIVGIVALCIWGQICDKYILHHFSGWIRLFIEMLLTAPIYVPTAKHFMKMAIKRKKISETEKE